ncbi:hypothetical protein, partial [Microbulbifer variabilis]|uniref:hypothetical protein n=1 Tax=Microbulbifer variabilis TaxID=266805 RepID=UPI001CFD5D08
MSTFFGSVAELQNSVVALNEILAGDEFSTVEVEGIRKPTISKAIQDHLAAVLALAQGRMSFQTKAALDAAGAPPGSELAEVWNDASEENNGLYGWNETAWVKSPYDPTASIIANRKALT